MERARRRRVGENILPLGWVGLCGFGCGGDLFRLRVECMCECVCCSKCV